MNKSIKARQDGDEYQQLYFWYYAMKLFNSDEGIEKIEFESNERKYFDDFVVFYKKESYPKNYLNNSISKEFFQIKYHVRNTELLSIDNLINKKYIGAQTSILERLKELNKKYNPDDIHYIFISTHDINPNDELYELISNEEGQISLETLFKGETSKSKMGKVREKFINHLNCSDDELKEILKPFRFKKGMTKEDLITRINDKLTLYGFEIIKPSSNLNKYCQLISKWHSKNQSKITKDFISQECEDEGLIKDYGAIDSPNNENLNRINSINNEFKQKYNNNPLINRGETDTIIHDIKNHNICILGEPGTGKTTLLYQIINKLDELNEYNYLILDLERYDGFTDSSELSDKMGFKYPIEKILENLKNPLLIIDQLDVISISRGLNTNSKSSIFALLKELNNKIPFIITCRDFDFKEDNEIKKFITAEENNINRLILNDFNDNQINEYLNRIGVENNFNKEQRKILSNPFNLNILKKFKRKRLRFEI